MQLLVKITFLIAILVDLGSAKKFKMSTEIYKEVEENGQRYKVYEPLNDNE
jgi:hypothetical protein